MEESTVKSPIKRGVRKPRIARQLTAKQLAFMETVPINYKNAMMKAYQGGLGSLVRAKCAECCGFEDVRVRVRECTVETCPCWPRRPFQTA